MAQHLRRNLRRLNECPVSLRSEHPIQEWLIRVSVLLPCDVASDTSCAYTYLSTTS
jgi:hypothetical protein